jgi:adenine phosphoribosyltransferase
MTAGGPGDAYPALRRAIRDVPDFPRPGIVFKDVTPLLADPDLYRVAVRAMSEPFLGAGITHVVAIESRGFLFGGPVALALGAGLVPVRKPGKLPYLTRRAEYELEYGTDALEIHGDAFGSPARVLVVDDVIATGGTAGATARLVQQLGGAVAGYSFLIELRFLNGRQRLGAVPAVAVLGY